VPSLTLCLLVRRRIFTSTCPKSSLALTLLELIEPMKVRNQPVQVFRIPQSLFGEVLCDLVNHERVRPLIVNNGQVLSNVQPSQVFWN
jgi:hypothetical protein